MHSNRRQFLERSAAVLAALTTGTRPATGQSSAEFTHPTAAFDVSDQSALVWVRGRRPGQQVQLSVAKTIAFSNATKLPEVRLSAERGLVHVFSVDGLSPDTDYFVRPATSGAAAPSLGSVAKFRTAPSQARPFSFVVGADTLAARKPFRLFDLMAARKPEFFLHLGDTIYADHPNFQVASTLDQYRAKHAENRDDEPMQRFMSAVPTFAMWDDHEVFNDFDRDHPLLPIGRQAFQEWWPVRANGPHRLHRRFSWGPLVDFFFLDTRQYRSPERTPDNAEKTILGSEQKSWLKDELKRSKAPLKILLSPSPVNASTNMDSWAGFKSERTELDRFIKTEAIRRVFVLSGDWHVALDAPHRDTSLDEVIVGPIAAWPLFEMIPKMRAQLAGTNIPHVGDAYNFGHVQIEPTPTGAKATIDIVDEFNKVRFSKTIES